MQIGFVGLGRMGGNMVHRIHRDSEHQVVAFDFNEDAVRTAEGNDLEGLVGHVADSGEGRWTIVDAIDHDVPTPVITASLYARFYSRGNGDFTHRVLAALRNQFGGHAVERAAGGG